VGPRAGLDAVVEMHWGKETPVPTGQETVWAQSRSGRCGGDILAELAPGTHWTGDCVDPRAGLDAVVEIYWGN
jgi:hypothetical protein